MQAPILQSRLNPPSLTGNLIDRPALMDILSGGADRKLILLSAPAGYGKTTLVGQWLRNRESPVAWISADGILRNPRVFIQYLLMSLGKIIDFANEPFWQITVLQSDWDPLFILGHLINEIVEREFRFLLVIDDYHLIDSPDISHLVSHLLDNLPPFVTLVITSRTDPLLPLAAMRTGQQTVEIRLPDLQFHASETSELLGRSSRPGTDVDIGSIQERTEGWISGIQLSSLALERNIPDLSGYARDFFVEEILRREDEELVSFLYRTSILAYLHASLCDAMLPDLPRPSEEILTELTEKNLFIRTVDSEQGWHVLHPMFRDSLAAGRTGDTRELHRRAGLWFRDRGLYSECFGHLHSSGDVPLIAESLIRCWDSMDQTFQNLPWLEWTEGLPETVIHSYPHLMNQMAWANLQLGRLEEAGSLLDRLESRLSDDEGNKALQMQILSARAYLAFVRKDPDRTIVHAQELQRRADRDDFESRYQAVSYLALCRWFSGDLRKADLEFTDFRNMMITSEMPFFALAGSLAQVQLRIQQGRLSDARDLLTEALGFDRGPADILDKFRASLHLRAAVLEFESGDRPSMNRHLAISEELARNGSLIDYYYQRHQFIALIHESDGRWNKALDELDMAAHLFVRTMNVEPVSIREQKARIWIRGKKKTTLRKYCGSLFENPVPEPSFSHETGLTLRIRYSLAFNRDMAPWQDQLVTADRLLEIAGREGRRRSTLELLILKAALLNELGLGQETVEALELILMHAEETGIVQSAILEKDLLVPLFRQYRDRLVSAETWQWLQGILSEHENTVRILSRRELEVLRLMARGFSNRRIGEELFVAETTIKGHNQKIFQKLNVATRTEAITEGRKAGLID